MWRIASKIAPEVVPVPDDKAFGQRLKEIREYDNTAVLFFSDHGMYAGDYGLVDINQNTFEDLVDE